jgi:transposase-like protein
MHRSETAKATQVQPKARPFAKRITVDEAKRRRVEVQAMVEVKGSIVAVAKELGVNERTVRRWLRAGS